MCTTIISSGTTCRCGTRPDRSVLAGVALAIGSLVLAVAWILTGPQLFGRGRRVRRYARRVHAAGRIGGALVLVAALLWPVATAVTVAVTAPALVALAVTGRRRAARHRAALAATDRPAIRVHPTGTGWPDRRHGQRTGHPTRHPTGHPSGHAWYGSDRTSGGGY